MADDPEFTQWLEQLANSDRTMQHQPALAAVDTAPNNVLTCVTCMVDQFPDAFPFINSDSHDHDSATCRKCLNRYVSGSINAGNARIACLECTEHLCYEDIQAIVSKTSLKKYDKLLLKASVEEDADFHYCLSAKCKSGQIHAGGDNMPIFECNACHYKQCIACQMPWHDGETCDQYQARQDEVTIETETLLHQTSKVCPGGCGARIERNGGCPHMTCRECSYEFCYHCLGAYTDYASHNECAATATAGPVNISEEIRRRQAIRKTRQNLHDFENERAEALIKKTFASCPRCKVFIEKAGGCDHITCSQCSYEFCYGCSADYKAILRDDNSRHKRSCVHYAARVSDRVIPTKTTSVDANMTSDQDDDNHVHEDDDDNHVHEDDNDEPSTVVPIAPETKPRIASKRTTKKKPSSIGKKKSAVAKKKATQGKKKVVGPSVVRRGTRTGLRSSTAAARGPITRSQTAAQRIT